jgi:hypothetical protein
VSFPVVEKWLMIDDEQDEIRKTLSKNYEHEHVSLSGLITKGIDVPANTNIQGKKPRGYTTYSQDLPY